eukprot:scaffold18972_cov36-Phaeocystis_antarctica.AAC.1
MRALTSSTVRSVMFCWMMAVEDGLAVVATSRRVSATPGSRLSPVTTTSSGQLNNLEGGEDPNGRDCEVDRDSCTEGGWRRRGRWARRRGGRGRRGRLRGRRGGRRRRRGQAASQNPARAIASRGEGQVARPCATDQQLVGVGQEGCALEVERRANDPVPGAEREARGDGG